MASALLVTVISHLVASRDLGNVRAEIKRLRGEMGYLEIKDPKKCYVVYVPQMKQREYLYRLYLR
jgi:hypothetical protein